MTQEVLPKGSTGAEAVLHLLRLAGHEYLFCSPGSEWAPIWEALAKLEAQGYRTPRYINCRHEALAVGAAVGHAKVTGRCSTVLLHTTVGTLNAAMFIRGAYHEQVPMLILAGETNTYGQATASGGPDIYAGSHWLARLADRGGPARLVDTYVKWAGSVTSPVTLEAALLNGHQIAMSPPQGPVFLSVPIEVLLAEAATTAPPTLSQSSRAVDVDQATLSRLATLLVDAQNPVAVTEYVGRDRGAVARLVELSELLGMPVVEFFPEHLNFPRNHPMHMGYESNARDLIGSADVVLIIGAQTLWHPITAGPASAAVVIAIDWDPVHSRLPFWGYRSNFTVEADPGRTLALLVSQVRTMMPQRPGISQRSRERLELYKRRHNKMVEAWTARATASAAEQPIDSQWLAYIMGQCLPKNAIIVNEAVSGSAALLQQIRQDEPGTYLSKRTTGLGMGPPFALGAKLALPDRLVVAVSNDGAFNYSPVLACLGMAQEYDLPIMLVIFNNQSYALMKESVLKFFPEGFAAQRNVFHGSPILPSPNYEQLAGVFDAYGARVERPSELETAIKEALHQVAQGRTALVNVVID